ncbi:actin-domain-containing protein [Kockovaella imperatae]|uniref:Actin-domain-containing protein n=1 Tax=Kockovaella imperatae TaxID=4999 RepID=A0A1Y1UKB5_9TREE|nr:actin-domain-containing protein [Kockovaella imperatae]ORX37906.1 actin-domain-containing protein [Kockovaella imperatae]
MAASAVPPRLSEGGPSTLTPVKRPTFVDTPGRSRPSGASPAYSSRKHSLYGIEDRVVLDLGSRVWKVGFSGETEPRAVFWAQGDRDEDGSEIWDLDMSKLQGCRGDRREGRRLVGVRLVRKLRDVFNKHLMSDPKLRKVIVVENTFLPIAVKEMIAQALFENLKIPSLAFTSSSLLSLAASGRITGLVIDIGWLETTVTPVYYSRPLCHLARSTPLAGRALHRRLRALLHHHGSYYPPSPSSSSARPHPVRPSRDVLKDQLIERIITEACFVVPALARLGPSRPTDRPSDPPVEEMDDVLLMDSLKSRYQMASVAKDLTFSVPAGSSGLPPGELVVPGWIRERAAEVLFDDDDEGESDGLATIVLQSILKLPVDLRPLLISTILVAGGTSSLSGLIQRLRISLLSLLRPPPDSSRTDNMEVDQPVNPLRLDSIAGTESPKVDSIRGRRRNLEPYSSLYPLASKLAILNDPSPMEGEGALKNAGVAPKWTPGLLSWVGASLAGVLKTSGPAMLLEDYETRLSTSASRGQVYRQELEETRAELAASFGLSLDELRPGEAVNDVKRENEYLRRKRGWRDSVIDDWTRGV